MMDTLCGTDQGVVLALDLFIIYPSLQALTMIALVIPGVLKDVPACQQSPAASAPKVGAERRSAPTLGADRC